MFLALVCLGVLVSFQQETSLPAGAKLPPYAFLLSIGEQRGRSHCYVCESQEKAAVILFVATRNAGGKPVFPSAKITQLSQFLDEALATRENLGAWLTVLHPKQEELDAPIVKWAAEAGLRNLPVGVFEDPLGPPAYRLGTKATMTAIIAKNGKVEKALAYAENAPVADFQKAILAELDRVAPLKAKAAPEAKAEAKPEAKPEIKSEGKPEAKPPAEKEKPKTESIKKN